MYDAVTFIVNFITSNISIGIPLLIFAIIAIIVWLFLPTLCQAAAVQYISRKYNNQQATLGTGMRYGILTFLPLFEYHMLMKTMSFFAVSMEAAFILRNLGWNAFKIFLPVFIIILIIGLILSLFLSYADFYIIIDNEKVFVSIWKSMRLVILNWQKTFLITLLMLLIGARIIIQILTLLFVPAVILFVTGYISMIWAAQIGFIVASLIGFAALLFAAYLSGAIDIFSFTVWTYTFLELTSEREISAREKMRHMSPREIYGATQTSHGSTQTIHSSTQNIHNKTHAMPEEPGMDAE